jgi:CRISP-associated protein Cas1
MARTLYVTEQGSTLSRKGERLVVEKAGETLADIPASKVVRVFVFGNVSLTTPAIAYLLKEGKDVAFLSNRGRYYGRLISSESKGAALRRAQLKASDDMATCLELSKRFVTGKLKNQRRLLHRRPGPRTSSVAKEMTTMIKRIQRTGSLEVLRGVEGYAARLYFGAFGGMLEVMKFVSRRRRPPPDPVNSMLSLGYTLLTYEAFSAASAVGLDPYVGFFHRDAYGRPSLALDIMEEFRPSVVDLLVRGAVNRGHIRREHFEVGQEAGEPIASLKEDARKRFFGLYEHRMLTQINHRSRAMTYREALRTQARQVVNSIKDRKLVYDPVLLS